MCIKAEGKAELQMECPILKTVALSLPSLWPKSWHCNLLCLQHKTIDRLAAA